MYICLTEKQVFIYICWYMCTGIYPIWWKACRCKDLYRENPNYCAQFSPDKLPRRVYGRYNHRASCPCCAQDCHVAHLISNYLCLCAYIPLYSFIGLDKFNICLYVKFCICFQVVNVVCFATSLFLLLFFCKCNSIYLKLSESQLESIIILSKLNGIKVQFSASVIEINCKSQQV